MSLEIYLAWLGVALLATLSFRLGTLANVARKAPRVMLTAASITMIEAAFLRAGSDGVEQVRLAANESGAQLADLNADVSTLAAGLAARGLSYAADTRRAMRNWRLAGCFLAAPAALAAAVQNVALGAGSRPWHWATEAEFAILWGGAVIALSTMTHLGSSTPRGREALAMRRAAYPLALLREADPTATVALYGGTLRRRFTDVSSDSDSSDCVSHGDHGEYVWTSDSGSSGHGHDGSGGHGSHSCSSTCSAGACGGH